MKTLNIKGWATLLLVAFLLPLLFTKCSSSKNVTSFSADEMQNIIDSTGFIFIADKLTSSRGTPRYLTNYYYVNVSKDELNSFLPYVGRIYHPLLDPSKGPLRFTSGKFTYNVSPKNKNAWEITIKPRDNSEVEQMRFDLFDNGTATLYVTSTDRDAISFSGRIEKLNG
jgi:hypothetical protein